MSSNEEEKKPFNQRSKKIFLSIFGEKSTVLLLVGSLLLILGSFLSWGKNDYFSSNFNIPGINNDGKVILLIGILIIILSILNNIIFNKKERLAKIIPFIYYLFIILVLSVIIWNGINTSGILIEYFKIAFNNGVYIILLGSFIIVTSILISLIRNKNKIIIIILTVLFIAILTYINHLAKQNLYQFSTELESENQHESEIVVVSKNHVTTSTEFDYIFGELKNVSNKDIYINYVNISLLKNGKVIMSKNSKNNIYLIKKEETIPFEITVPSNMKYDDIKVKVYTTKNNNNCERLSIVSQNPSNNADDEFSDFIVNVEIENTTDRNFTDTTVVYVWLLDENNNVIGNATAHIIEGINKGSRKQSQAKFLLPKGEKPKKIKAIAEGCYYNEE